MPIEYKNFKYPLTCCPINSTDSIAFNRTLSCAINGLDIYEIVRSNLFNVFKKKNVFSFRYLELLPEVDRFISFDSQYSINYRCVYPFYRSKNLSFQ